MNRDKLAATWRHYLGSAPASPAAGAGRRPVRPATRLHRDSGIRPAPRRSHCLRAAPAGGAGRSSCTSGPAPSTGRTILSAAVSQRQIAELVVALRRALAE